MKYKNAEKLILAGILLLGFAGTAFAGDPMADGMCQMMSMLTGKWAFGLSVIALLAVAAAFMFGVEMSEVMKKMVTFVTAVAVVIGGSNFLAFLFSAINVTFTKC